ncbi:MAG: YqcC family protein [Pseudomonas sp.]|nr:YqcC family protein [Pseudomonas sp.]
MTADAQLHLIALLSKLEDELRQLGWWEQQAPSVQALQSQQPFCVDTLKFPQWLQWVFIPRIHSIVQAGQALPSQCAIYEMAEVVYREQLSSVSCLLSCLKRIDTAIVSPHRLH